MDQGAGRARRRRYSAQFKAEAVAACRKPGASTAAAALERSMNANILRRWVVEAERAEGTPRTLPAPPAPTPKGTFVALPMPPGASDTTPITVEVRRGTITLSLQWPRSAAHECAMWLREVFK
jgi:transposase